MAGRAARRNPGKSPGKSRASPRTRSQARNREADAPSSILVVDIGGSKVKMLATGHAEPRKIASGANLTPDRMVRAVLTACKDWRFGAVSVGYPGLTGPHGPRSEPGNLGPGWVGFNFAAAFAHPVRIINDAAMQALGSYEGGRMLFLGLGTGVGSSLIAQNVIVPLELGELAWGERETLGAVLGRKGLKRYGKRVWRNELLRQIERLTAAFSADYVVLGGGNARLLQRLPPGTRIGNNLAAFRGGFRLWQLPDVPTLSADGESSAPSAATHWRVI